MRTETLCVSCMPGPWKLRQKAMLRMTGMSAILAWSCTTNGHPFIVGRKDLGTRA